jgi:Uncharacterised ArCR, COG2043
VEKAALLNVNELGKKLTEAGKLKLRPLCVYGSDEIPEGAVPSYEVDRCIAKAVYTSALFEHTPPLYVEATHEYCCAGGMVWTGFAKPNPMLKYFVTVGTPEFRGGAAEHLKASPELFEESTKHAGKITPPAKYIIVGPCSADIEKETVRAFILFAGSEQIRNLCGLAQFNSSDIFYKTVLPGGPTCATMLTFPTGMAENAPKGSAFVGPVDPTGNSWLPPDLLIMGIPAELAKLMASNMKDSFICKRRKIAYPESRTLIKPKDVNLGKIV